MKAERLIKILILLQHGETISTRRLAGDLEVSERTVHRDMEALSAAGIPVYSERGQTGGWRLIDEWKHKLSWLKEKEITSLFLQTSDKVLADLNLDISTKEVKNKLLLSVPQNVRGNAASLWERIYIDTSTWREGTEKPTFLKQVQQALMEDKKLHMQYTKSNGEIKSYTIRPLGLVMKGNTWYVVVLNEKEEYRNFKLSRISNLSIGEEKFQRPEEFVLADYWKTSKKEFIQRIPEYFVEVGIQRDIVQRVMFSGRFSPAEQEINGVNDPKWIKGKLSFPSEEEAVIFLMGFGNKIKVTSPEHIIIKLKKRAGEIIEAYR